MRFAFLAAILNFALVFYLLRKSVKCILNARLFSKVQEDSKKSECRSRAQHASSESIFDVHTQIGTHPTRIAGWSITADLITVVASAS